MSKLNNLTDFLTSLANAFRSKLGTTATINPQDFDSKVTEVYDAGYEQGKAEGGSDVDFSTITDWTYFNYRGARSNLVALLTYDDGRNATNFSYMNYNASSLTEFPSFNTSNGTNFNSTFSGDSSLRIIGGFNLTKATNVNNTFNGCTALVDITFNGTISITGLDLHWSTSLSKDSFISAINALSSATTERSITFSDTAKKAAFTDGEWANLVATKSNWNIILL